MKIAQAVSIRWLLRSRVLIFIAIANLVACETKPPSLESQAPQVLQQWLDAFNSGNPNQMAGFWRSYHETDALVRMEDDLDLRNVTGTMKVVKVTENTGTHLVALMKEQNGDYSESSVELASSNPLILERIGNYPIPKISRSELAAASDEDLATRIQNRIATQFPPENAFSGAILVAHQGRIILDRAWGMANSAKHIRNTIDTQFNIASMGKMFTAIAVLQLVEQGKLALDEPIARYWRDYPNPDLARQVTVRELLDHTGGTGDAFTPEYFTHRLETRSLTDYVRLLGHRPVRFDPGTRMEYSNYGYILLGRLIELTSGETYDSYVQRHIFAPAGMSHTDSRPEASRGGERAIGYMRSGHGLIPNTSILPWAGTSAGGEYSTAHDLLQFASTLRSGRLINRAFLRQATTDQTHYGYGLGFSLVGEGSFGHIGGMPGVSGELLILPRSAYVLIVLANRGPRTADNMVEFIRQSLPQPSM